MGPVAGGLHALKNAQPLDTLRIIKEGLKSAQSRVQVISGPDLEPVVAQGRHVRKSKFTGSYTDGSCRSAAAARPISARRRLGSGVNYFDMPPIQLLYCLDHANLI